MKAIDACENAYHNGYEKGFQDALESVAKILEEIKTKGDTKDDEIVAEGGADSCDKDNGADRYCEHRNLCALN